MYADLGHFGRKPILIGWYAVGPCRASSSCISDRVRCCSASRPPSQNPFFRMARTGRSYPLVGLGHDGHGHRIAGLDLGCVLAHRVSPSKLGYSATGPDPAHVAIPDRPDLHLVDQLGPHAGLHRARPRIPPLGEPGGRLRCRGHDDHGADDASCSRRVPGTPFGWNTWFIVPLCVDLLRHRPRILRRDVVQDPRRRLVPAGRGRRRVQHPDDVAYRASSHPRTAAARRGAAASFIDSLLAAPARAITPGSGCLPVRDRRCHPAGTAREPAPHGRAPRPDPGDVRSSGETTRVLPAQACRRSSTSVRLPRDRPCTTGSWRIPTCPARWPTGCTRLGTDLTKRQLLRRTRIRCE